MAGPSKTATPGVRATRVTKAPLLALASAALVGALAVAAALLVIDGGAGALALVALVAVVALAALAGTAALRRSGSDAEPAEADDAGSMGSMGGTATGDEVPSGSAPAAFAAAIVHDLRSPLVTVHSYLELLTEEAFGPIPNEAKQAARRATLAAGRAQELIEETLRRYAVEAAGRPLDAPAAPPATTVDLGPLIDGVVASLDAEIRKSGAEVEVGELPSVRGHSAALHRVFANLIENALKYHVPGERPRITVSCDAGGGRCEVVVRDHGIGIPAEQHARIFDVRARVAAAAEQPGLGLGLATVRELIAQQGGQVWVDAAVTDGACFRVSLPAA